MHHRAKRLLDSKYTYMVTISHTKKKKYIQQFQIVDIIHQLKLRIPNMETSDYHYELGALYKQLHVHFIGKTPSLIHFRNNCRIDGFFIKWRRVWSKGIYSYIQKDTPNSVAQDLVFQQNYYNHNYGFI